MTTQEKILEAKQLLEQYAPKGEFLAYINEDEAKTLKKLGGSGIIIKETGIPSFIYWMAIALAASTTVSFMGSLNTINNLKAGAAWDRYNANIRKKHTLIKANLRAADLLSEKRAAGGARGVSLGVGSPLLVEEVVIANLEDTVFWINQGAEMTLREIDMRLSGMVMREKYKAGESLLSGAGATYEAYDEWATG